MKRRDKYLKGGTTAFLDEKLSDAQQLSKNKQSHGARKNHVENQTALVNYVQKEKYA